MAITAIDLPITSQFGDRASGVEVVLAMTSEQQQLLTPATLKLIGVLQRRSLGRFQSMTQRRTLHDTGPAQGLAPIEFTNTEVTLDLYGANTWHGRLDATLAGSQQRGVVRIRDWGTTENGILVDGRPVMAPVFDVAIAMASRVGELRRGNVPIVFVVPVPDDDDATRLWTELITLAEARLGVERGTVQFSTRIVASASAA